MILQKEKWKISSWTMPWMMISLKSNAYKTAEGAQSI
jgi:hypothetical protein